MATAIGIGLLVTLGILVVGYNFRIHMQFDAFSRDVAAERGEVEELDDPRGGFDEGYTGYRHRIQADLFKGVVDPGLSEALKRRAELLTHTLAMTRGASMAFIGIVVILGLVFHW
jgi:hypothetical protein